MAAVQKQIKPDVLQQPNAIGVAWEKVGVIWEIVQAWCTQQWHRLLKRKSIEGDVDVTTMEQINALKSVWSHMDSTQLNQLNNLSDGTGQILASLHVLFCEQGEVCLKYDVPSRNNEMSEPTAEDMTFALNSKWTLLVRIRASVVPKSDGFVKKIVQSNPKFSWIYENYSDETHHADFNNRVEEQFCKDFLA